MSKRAVDTIGHHPVRARRYIGRIVIDRTHAMTVLRTFFPLAIAMLLAPPPAAAQRVDVCALVSCSASGQRATVLDDPAPARREEPEAATRDPWARRFQGRESEDDDVCLLNFGIGGQLARKGELTSHALGRTQTWRAAAQDGR
jgi:hypothetical protein